MGRFFRNDLHEEFGTWPLGYTADEGADVGEIIAVADAVGDGDDTAYFEAWMAAGDRLRAEAEAARERGLRASAGELFLAPRAAAGEPRLAACIADPGSWGIGPGLKSFAAKVGLSAADIDNLNALDQGVYDRMQEVIDTNPRMRWSFVQRGFWVHGVDNLRDYIRVASQFTLEGWVEKIRCPTLLTAAENDPLSAGTEALFAALQCPKSLIRFTAAEGAGDHCEMQNRSLLNRRVLDWLDLTLAGKVP